MRSRERPIRPGTRTTCLLQHLLAGGAGDELQELLRSGCVLRGLQHPATGHGYERPWVLVAEVMGTDVGRVLAGLRLVAVVVVVVDQRGVDLAELTAFMAVLLPLYAFEPVFMAPSQALVASSPFSS